MAEMMTDRELLELAAKAPGAGPYMKYMEWDGFRFVEHKVHGVPHCGLNYEETWNPLIDDGDAMRLAADLDMMLTFSLGGFAQACSHDGMFDVDYADDRCAAMRRAIGRSAAEIGKGV